MTKTVRAAAIGTALLLSAGVVGVVGHGAVAAAASATRQGSATAGGAGSAVTPGSIGNCPAPPSLFGGRRPCPPLLSGAGTAVTPADIAQALGVTLDRLRQDAQAGQTVADIAGARGMDRSAFFAKLEGIIQAQLEQEVSAGTITAAEEASALQALQQGSNRLWDSVPGRPPLPPRAPAGPGPLGLLRPGPGGALTTVDVAKALGVTVAQLQQDLAAGKTVAEVGAARGVSEAAFLASLKAGVATVLDGAVGAGTITSAQANAYLAAQQQDWSRLWNAASLPAPVPSGLRGALFGPPPAGGAPASG